MSEFGKSICSEVGKGARCFLFIALGIYILVLQVSPVQAELQQQQLTVIEGSVIRDITPIQDRRVGIGSYASPPSVDSGSDNSEATAGGILIWLENNDNSADYKSPSENLPVLNQIDKKFEPRLLAVRVGGSVRILNSDPLYHNVFSLSSHNKFDVGHRTPGEFHDEQFDTAGIVDVFCDLHSDMHAVIRVLPRQTVSWELLNDSGDYRFENIEPGEYTLHYYAIGNRQQSFTVQVNGPGLITREEVRLRGE